MVQQRFAEDGAAPHLSCDTPPAGACHRLAVAGEKEGEAHFAARSQLQCIVRGFGVGAI